MTVALAAAIVLIFTATSYNRNNHKSIEDGMLINGSGEVIVTNFDRWGYNYRTHTFNGFIENADCCGPFVENGTILQMKWNDAWLSNMDFNRDRKLDRHSGYDCYKGSGAWVTNNQRGMCIGKDGTPCKWEYFVKIVAAPVNATLSDGVWYTAHGERIGPAIWGEFAIIQEVYNDPCGAVERHCSPPVAPGGLEKSDLVMMGKL
jgi:hypothetical protein